ncbi:hypothetical protein Salat_2379300 [Sesamum alatum]|uniref:C2H2-type domain-containing protein n=1 Tax=Sesamum alatum TaxID=300844 RepID=A0AAE1XX99_9LAMI|nr:hypothetical protein Salat_2379300 [Sesamum alatum]
MGRQSEVFSKNSGALEGKQSDQNPVDPPSNGKSTETKIQIDLVYCLRRGWRTTNRRGKPGKSIVLYQGPPGEPINYSLPPTKKRNLEAEAGEDDGNPPNPSAKKLILMEPDSSSTSRPPVSSPHGGERAPHSRRADKGKAPAVTPQKQHLCSNCRKMFDSYFPLGGHRAFHVRETRRWCVHQPSWTELWYGQQRAPQAQEPVQELHECPWCKRGFTTRQGVSAHSRFCRKRREEENVQTTGNQNPAVGRNFDLNQLPPEAYLPEDILRLTWR